MTVEHSSNSLLGVGPLFAGATTLAQSERQLLDRFVSARDELAFEAIVARHGPMVTGVCRSVLANSPDVDDAFQATFLVLARKAGSLRDGDQLSPWLHGVARRVALRARANSAKRRDRETPSSATVATAPDRSYQTPEDRELAALLHVELDRLPLPERSALLLCDLEGLSHQEAADQLGWPLGTVKSRVTRGRERLRARLLRRGVTLSTSAVASTLTGEALASAVVARAFVLTTTRAALAIAAGQALSVGLMSPSVCTLTQGAVRAMFFSKLKIFTLGLAAATTTLAVPTLVAFQQSPRLDPGKPEQPAAETKPLAAENPVSAAPALSDSPLTKAASPIGLRAKLALVAIDSITEQDRNGKMVADSLRCLWYRRLADAEYEGANNGRDRLKAVQSYVSRLEAFVVARSKTLSPSFDQIHDEIWNNATTVDAELTEARNWLAAVQTEPNGLARGPITKVSESIEATTSQIADDRPPWRVRIKPQASDNKLNQAILAKLNERIAMNFPNDTPLHDVQHYIEQSTQDEVHGLPTGIPIYVDPKSMKDTGQTLATTVSINLEGVPLRTTLALILNQLDLSYVVEGGVLIILSTDPNLNALERSARPQAARTKP